MPRNIEDNLIGAEAEALEDDADELKRLQKIADADNGGEDAPRIDAKEKPSKTDDDGGAAGDDAGSDDGDDAGDGADDAAAAAAKDKGDGAKDEAGKAGGAAGEGSGDGGGDDAAGDPDADEAALIERGASLYLAMPSLEGVDDRLKAIDTERKEARTSHADGTLSREELDDKLDALADERQALLNRKGEFEAAQSMNRQLFQREVQEAFREARRDGVDYAGNAGLRAMFDAKTRALAADEDSVKKGDAWILRAAHKAVLRDIRAIAGVADPEPPKGKGAAADAGKGGDKGKPATAADKAKVRDAVAARGAKAKADAKDVRNLATAPAAGDAAETGGDEFADIETLTGMDYELAIARKIRGTSKEAAFLRGE